MLGRNEGGRCALIARALRVAGICREAKDAAHLLPDLDSPRLVFEYLGPDLQWKSLDVEDGTSNLTSSGVVGFLAATTSPCNCARRGAAIDVPPDGRITPDAKGRRSWTTQRAA